jgi:hypothetical protein
MNKQERIEDLLEMYRRITDPEEIEKNKRARERLARRELRIADTGL